MSHGHAVTGEVGTGLLNALLAADDQQSVLHRRVAVGHRRHRLVQHGLDPDLVNKLEREKNSDLYDEYHRKYRGERRRPSN